MTLSRRAAFAALAAVAATTALVAPAPAVSAAALTVHEVYPVPPNGVFTLDGHGWGHGHGMSQWGAYGAAAVHGLTDRQILAFYYPHTTLVTDVARNVRVRLHAASTGAAVVVPVTGKTLTASTTVSGVAACTLPASTDGGTTTVQRWRAVVVTSTSPAMLQLESTSDNKTWQPAAIAGCDPAWSKPLAGSVSFSESNGIVQVVFPGGTVTPYRGRYEAAYTGSGMYPVNVVGVDAYLRSVVPSEMPASWSAAALQAQAVAARTYATYGIAHPKTAYYDVWDDTRDQMYTGTAAEHTSSTDAVTATARQVLHDGNGHAAFTQFSASDGGWTVDGGQPYLPAQQDPYDGAIANDANTWRTTLAVSAINNVYSGQIGSLREIDVTGRDGNGQWGGRVTTLTLVGGKGSVTVSGTTFRFDFGLRSEWWRIVLPPNPPRYVTAGRAGNTATVSWRPPTPNGGAPVTGYRVVLRPGPLVKTVSATTRSVSFSGLAAGTDYTADVAATSAVGRGRYVTVTTKVRRSSADTAAGVAAAISRATFPAGGARVVVLASTRGYAHALAAGSFAAGRKGPVLLTGRKGLSRPARVEIQRVLPKGRRVFLLGGTTMIGDGVRTTLRNLGYRVVRFAGSTPDATAVLLANHTPDVRTVFEVTRNSFQDAVVAAPVAAKRHGVILLTDGTTQSPATARWLAAHPGLTRFAIGAEAAAADPKATAVAGSGVYQTVQAVASRFFTAPAVADVASGTAYYAGLAAGGRLGRVHGPLLLTPSPNLPAPVAGYVAGVRTSLKAVELDGTGLPYYNVESGIQAALLG